MEGHGTARLIWGVLGGVVVLGALGAWGLHRGSSALDQFRTTVEGIGYARGGQIPDTRAIRARVEALARDQGVTLTGLSVQRRETSTPDRVAKLANERLASVGAIRMARVVFDVRAHATVTRLGLTSERDIAVELSYRSRVELAPNAGDLVPPNMPIPEDVPRGIE